MRFIAFDPGASGGIAMIEGSAALAWKFPETEADIVALVKDCALCPDVMVTVEAVHYMPGQYGSFEFGQNYGFLRGMLAALNVPRQFISPQKWQGFLGLKMRSEAIKAPKGMKLSPEDLARNKQIRAGEKIQHKRDLKQKAQELYPSLKVTLATCDALLIATAAARGLR